MLDRNRMTDAEKITLAAQIRLVRESRGWGREKLARECGLSTRTIEKIEWKHQTMWPQRITLIRLQSVLGLDLVADYSEGMTETQADEEIETEAQRDDRLARIAADRQLDTPRNSYEDETDGYG